MSENFDPSVVKLKEISGGWLKSQYARTIKEAVQEAVAAYKSLDPESTAEELKELEQAYDGEFYYAFFEKILEYIQENDKMENFKAYAKNPTQQNLLAFPLPADLIRGAFDYGLQEIQVLAKKIESLEK